MCVVNEHFINWVHNFVWRIQFKKGSLYQPNWVQRMCHVGVLLLIGLEKWQFFCTFAALVLGRVAGLCGHSWCGRPQKAPSIASNGTLAAVRILLQQQAGMSLSLPLPGLLACLFYWCCSI